MFSNLFLIKGTLPIHESFFFFLNLKLLIFLNGNYVVIFYPFTKKIILIYSFIYLFIPLNPISAFESKNHMLIDRLVKNCYSDTKTCKEALVTIHNYQKNAAVNKKFSCQTRLLGLEANIILAMNSILKRNDAKSIIRAMKKYC